MTRTVTKEEWVAALRSGKYEQGQEALRNAKNEFCCLGVYADLKGFTCKNPFNSAYWYTLEDENGEIYAAKGMLVSHHFDFPISDRFLERLAARNDQLYSFEQIAEMIEQYEYNPSEAE